MTKKLVSRLALMSCAMATVIFVPETAMAATVEQSSLLAQYLDEVVIGGLLLGAVIALDTASWSFMTTRR